MDYFTRGILRKSIRAVSVAIHRSLTGPTGAPPRAEICSLSGLFLLHRLLSFQLCLDATLWHGRTSVKAGISHLHFTENNSVSENKQPPCSVLGFSLLCQACTAAIFPFLLVLRPFCLQSGLQEVKHMLNWTKVR